MNAPLRHRRPTARERLEAIVERALALLDEIDGDWDLEPSLGWMPCVSEGVVDVEFDEAEQSGIADAEGLGEQLSRWGALQYA